MGAVETNEVTAKIAAVGMSLIIDGGEKQEKEGGERVKRGEINKGTAPNSVIGDTN